MYVDSLELCARNRRSRRGISPGIYGAWDGCTQVKYINDFIREQRFDKALRLQMKRHYNYRLRFKSVFLEDQILGDLPPHLRAQVGRSSAPPTHPQKKKKKKKAVWSLPQKAVVGCGSPSACRLHSSRLVGFAGFSQPPPRRCVCLRVCVVPARLGFAGFDHRRAAACLRRRRSSRFRWVQPPPRRSTTAAPLCVCIVAARLGSRFLGCLFHPRTATLVCSNRSFCFVDEPRRLPPPRARRRSYISTATRCHACRTSASSRQSSRACSACCSPRSVRGGVSRIKTTTSYKRRTRCYSPPSCGA